MLLLLTTELLPLVLTLLGFGAGLLTGWHFTGRYYRKLVTELIERHCELTSQMRQEHARTSSDATNTSAA